LIDKLTVRKILDTAEIVDVVGDYVHLTKRGANYMGLCPFHNERTPSFSVSPSRNICKCFSCGKGGSPVNFIMEMEGINFHDAVLRLAGKYGIKVEERELTDKEREAESKRESMYVLSEWVATEMQKCLLETKEGHDIGLQYLYGREVTDEAIKKFRLGYSPDSFTAICDKAIKAGFSEELLLETGICGRTQQGKLYDRFKGRVIFPIMTTAGRVIAFGGRGIKGEKAKYINSPETHVYTKSNELYGMAQARNAISRNKKCYLVEGYLDVIGMWQSGLENTVASSGTSLTDGQIALIHRFTENVTLIYDGDAAGIKASLRGIDMLLRHRLNIKVVLMPDGEDPDSFSHTMPPEQFRNYIRDHETDFIRFKARTMLEDAADDPQKRSEAIESVVTSIAAIPDKVKRLMYVQECSRLMHIGEELLVQEVTRAVRGEIANLSKRMAHRDLDRIDRQQPQATPQSTDIPVDISSREMMEDSSYEPHELEIIRYCVRYGMSKFCDCVDEQGNVSFMTVLEYATRELQVDGVWFKKPIHCKVIERLNEIQKEYKAEVDARFAELEAEAADKRRAKLNELASTAIGTVNLMAKAEEKINMEVDMWLENEKNSYSRMYAQHLLTNDPDDEVRALCTDLVSEPYTLSKIHTHSGTIETEYERLQELIPEALANWKALILKWQYRHLQEKLANPELPEHEKEKLIMEMQHLSELRCDVAKYIGERIIAPK